MLGDTTGSNIQASLAHAGQITQFNRFSTVLYINTVQTDRKFSESVRKVFQGSHITAEAFPVDERKIVHIINSPLGELHKLRGKIEGKIWENSITTVIINSWEFASKNSRFREELLFLIKHLLEGNAEEGATYPFDPQTVIIYGEAPSHTPVAGKIQRGGYGKLSGLADKVFFTDANGDLQNYETASTKKIEAIMQQAKKTESTSMPEAEFIIDGIEYPSEDEEGISSEERHDRFVNRMRAIGKRDQRIKEEKETEAAPQPDETTGTIDAAFTDIPATSIEALRNTPDSLSRMPIHLNSYSPDKAPVMNTSKTESTVSKMIKK